MLVNFNIIFNYLRIFLSIFLTTLFFLVVLPSATKSQDGGKDISTKASPDAGAREFPVTEGAAPDNSKSPYYNLVFFLLIVFLSIPALLFIIANLIKKTPKYTLEECSRCKSIKLERIPRTFWHILLSSFLVKSRIKRYKCLNCNWVGIKISD